MAAPLEGRPPSDEISSTFSLRAEWRGLMFDPCAAVAARHNRETSVSHRQTGSPTRDADTHHQAYRIIGGAGDAAFAAGLVNAVWYKCPVPRAVMKALMQRSDAAALRDTFIWYGLIVGSGGL